MQADAQLRQAHAILADLQIKAPQAGRVVYKLVEVGNVIAAGQKVVSLLDLNEASMYLFFPAPIVNQIPLQSEARLVFDGLEAVFPATVSYVSSDAQFTPKFVETTTEREKLMFKVKLQIPSDIAQKYADYLKGGMTGNGYIRLSSSTEWHSRATTSLTRLSAGGGMNTIRVVNVTHTYQKTTALDQVSLSLPAGSTVGLIGPDGVGKSTLLSLLAGVKILQQGQITVFGLSQAEKAERECLLKRIAFMPQGLGRNLYPTLSVYENIEFHACLFGLTQTQRQQRIQRLLLATGLAPFQKRAAGNLSGGMKQKLSLCCALVHNPDLLILDEPTTGACGSPFTPAILDFSQ